MDANSVISLLKLKENVVLSFLSPDNPDRIYETVCAFANRFGGEILVGNFSASPVTGLDEPQAAYLVGKITDDCSDSNLFVPSLFICPRIVHYKDGFLLHIHVNASNRLVTFKTNVYLRERSQNEYIEDSLQKKQLEENNIRLFFESRVFPYIGFFDLRIDILPKVRHYATCGQGRAQNWSGLNDHELINAAGLGVMDRETGKKGFNLAAVVVLGKDQLIHEVIPHYSTVFECRRGNADVTRTVVSNYLESSEKLSELMMMALSDITKGLDLNSADSLNRMMRELAVNSLIHRDLSSSYQARIVITDDELVVENASKPVGLELISEDGIGYYAKNPVIEQFFYSLGFASLRGNGIPTIFTVCKECLNSLPVFENNEVFRCVVPLKPQITKPSAEPVLSETDQTDKKDSENQNVSPDLSAQTSGFTNYLDQKLNFIKNVQIIRRQQSDQKSSLITMKVEQSEVKSDQTEQKPLSNHTVVPASSNFLNKLEIKQQKTEELLEKLDESGKVEQKESKDVSLESGEFSPHSDKNVDINSNRSRMTIKENESGWLPFADPQIELLNIIKLYPKMTNVELAKTLGWSPSRIKFYVQKLKKAGVVSRIGTDRKGYWKVF